MKNYPKFTAVLAAAGVLTFVLPALADDSAVIEQLKQQIQTLDQKVRVLERKGELDKEAATERAKTASSVSIGAGGFQVRSADTNFVLKVRGYVQTDGRFYPGDDFVGKANDTFLLRRVRPIFEGTLFEKYDYRVMLDFGQNVSSSAANNGFLQDAYLNARFLPEFQVQFGKFKEPVGLERLQSGANMLFIERGYPTQLAPNRDVGVQIHGELGGGLFNYAVGVFNGVANGGSGDFDAADEDKDFAARVFAHPFKNTDIDGLSGLGIGAAVTYGNQLRALRNFTTPGQQRFFGYRTGAGTSLATANVTANGRNFRFAPQFYYYWGSFGLLGEYTISRQQVSSAAGPASGSADLRHTGWQLAASYFLTGEKNSWRAVAPKKPFDLSKGGWGAWEIAARVGELDVDDNAFPLYANPATSATKAFSWALGVNWHLNRNVKFSLDYEKTKFKGGTGQFLTDGEDAITARAQVAW